MTTHTSTADALPTETLAAPNAETSKPRHAEPATGKDRVALVDSLRGFALGGVFLANLYVWMSGRVFLPMEQAKALSQGPLNKIAGFIFGAFISGKCVAIFSFLFGLGFSLQLGRSEERGAPAGKIYARRLAVLFCIGLTHLFFLWFGDITHLYAVIGVFLLLFRRAKDRTLLILGLLFGFLVPPAAQLVENALVPYLRGAAPAGPGREMGDDAFRASLLSIFQGSDYLAIVRANGAACRKFFLNLDSIWFDIGLLGNFLLGYWFGRRRVFQDVPSHRRLLRHLAGWGLGLGLLINCGAAVARLLVIQGTLKMEGALRHLMPLAFHFGALILASGYIGAMALLFQREWSRRFFSILAPAGQMALTNYLGQSAFQLFFFTGIGAGYIGKLGPAICCAISFGFYWVEIGFSHLWLSRFRFGPVEWVWRSLTYGKMQPMRKRAAVAQEA